MMQMTGPPPPAVASPDLTFTLKGLMGEFLLRSNAPDQYLKSVTLGGADITDTPREFKTGDKVTIALTSRASTLEGTVTDAKGEPSTEAGADALFRRQGLAASNSIKMCRDRRRSERALQDHRV